MVAGFLDLRNSSLHHSNFTNVKFDALLQVCWVHNTYFVPFDERLPKRGEHRNTIGYYQWVALLLCMMVSA